MIKTPTSSHLGIKSYLPSLDYKTLMNWPLRISYSFPPPTLLLLLPLNNEQSSFSGTGMFCFLFIQFSACVTSSERSSTTTLFHLSHNHITPFYFFSQHLVTVFIYIYKCICLSLLECKLHEGKGLCLVHHCILYTWNGTWDIDSNEKIFWWPVLAVGPGAYHLNSDFISGIKCKYPIAPLLLWVSNKKKNVGKIKPSPVTHKQIDIQDTYWSIHQSIAISPSLFLSGPCWQFTLTFQCNQSVYTVLVIGGWML